MANDLKIDIEIAPQLNADEMRKIIKELASMEIAPDISMDAYEAKLIKIANLWDKSTTAIEADPISVKVDDALFTKFEKNLDNLDFDFDFSDFEKALDKMSDEDLAKMQKKIKETSETFDFKKAQKEVEALDAEFAKIKTQAQASFNEQRSVVANLAKAGKTNTDEYKEAQKELQKRRATLKEITDSEKEVGDAINESNKKLSFMDKLEKVGKVTDGIQNLSSSVMTVTEPFVQLDSATQKIKTLGGAAKDVAPQLREMSMQAAKDLPIGPAEHLTATYEALSAGISPAKEQIGAFMDAAAKFAVGGNETIGNSVNLLSSMINAYGESATKTTEYSDVLFQTINLGKISASEMNASMSQVVPTAAAYGFSIKSVGASLSLLTSNGVPAAQSTTMLNQLLIEMQKPGADLTKILNGAGVTVESLGKKVKSGDVVGAFKDMDAAFKKSGMSATQAFSSAESGKAFNTLTKDFGKLQEMFDGISQSSGATQAAYNEMSGTIENRSKVMKASIDSALIGFLDKSGVFGTVAMTAAQSLGQLTPMLSSLSGFKILFDGVGSSVAKSAKEILVKLVPSLFTQVAATEGATAAQMQFNAAALLNPYIAAAALIAGVAAYFLFFKKSAAETTQSQIDENKAAQDTIKSQIDATNAKKATIDNNNNMIASFEALATKQNRTKEENDQLRDMQEKLAEAYPGTIQANEDFMVSLGKLKGKAAENKQELGKLGKQLDDFTKQNNDLQLQEKVLNIRVEADKIEENTESNLQNHYIEQYANALNAAKNSDQVKKAAYEAKMAMVNSDDWKDMDAAQKKAVLSGIDKMAKAAQEKADLAAKQSTEILNTAINNIATNDGYNTTVEEVAAKSKKSVSEVSDAMIKAGAVQVSQGKDADKVYNKLAQTLHKSPEEIKAMIAAQKDSKEVTEAQIKSAKDLAETWEKSKKATSDAFSQSKGVYGALNAQLAEEAKKGANADKKKIADIKEQIKETLKKGAEEAKNSHAQAAVDARFEKQTGMKIEKGKTALEQAKAEFDIKSSQADIAAQTYEIGIKTTANQAQRKLTALEELLIGQKAVETAEAQKKAYIEILKNKKLITENDDGEIEISTKLKPVESVEIQKQINTLQEKVLTASEKYQDIRLKAKVSDKDLNSELDKAQLSLDKKKLEIKIELKEADYKDVDAYIERAKTLIISKKEELNRKLKDANAEQAIDIKKELLNIESEEIELAEYGKGEKKKIGDQRINDLQAQFDKENEMRKAQLEKTDSIEKILTDAYNESGSAAIDAAKNNALDKLDKQKEAELARLGENAKAKEAATAKYAERKATLEAEYAQKELIQSSMIAGAKKQADDARFLEESNRKIAQLQQLKRIAAESGDTEAAKKYQGEIDDLSKQVSEKSDVLNESMQTLGGGMAEGLADAFAGNFKGAKKAMKKSLAELAGYLKQLALGKILEIVLKSDMITGLAAAAGFAAPLVIGAATLTIKKGVDLVANPLINGLLSFATGGRVESPTLFQAGDASIQGGNNTEWILRDNQFNMALNEAVEKQKASTAAMLASAFGDGFSASAVVSGDDLLLIIEKAKGRQNARIRG